MTVKLYTTTVLLSCVTCIGLTGVSNDSSLPASSEWVGGDRGVTISRFPYPVLPPPVRFCPFVSRLPPFIVFLPLSCKSRCLTPYSDSKIGSALALSKIKNCVVNRTTPHFPARSLKRHSFDTSLHHAAKSSLQFPC